MTQPEALRLAAWADEHMPFDYEKQAIVDTLRRQHAEIERLRAALRPFAGDDEAVEYLVGGIYQVTVNGRDLTAARAALEQT